jgi:hypothetical protein
MNSAKFISLLKAEIDSSLRLYSDSSSNIGKRLGSMRLSESDRLEVLNIVKEAVTENLYVLISALEGSSSLDGEQQIYTLSNENNEVISGELDAEFFMQIIEPDEPSI